MITSENQRKSKLYTSYKYNKTINNDNKFEEQINAVSNSQTESSNEKSIYEKAFENIGAKKLPKV